MPSKQKLAVEVKVHASVKINTRKVTPIAPFTRCGIRPVPNRNQLEMVNKTTVKFLIRIMQDVSKYEWLQHEYN